MGDVPLIDTPDGVDSDAWNAAIATIRARCEWHVAPVATQNVTVEAQSGGLLMLPTLQLNSVEAILDESGDPVSWDRIRSFGVVYGPFRSGRDYTVKMTHGLEKWPLGLAGIAQALAQVAALSSLSQVTAGPFNFSTPPNSESGALTDAQEAALAMYALPPRP